LDINDQASSTESGVFLAALIANDRVQAERIAAGHISESGAIPFVENIAVPTLERIGSSWQKGELALSQVYVSGRICEDLVTKALSRASGSFRERPRAGIAVLLDNHGLGSRVVAAVVRAAGYRLIDYGTGIGPEELAEKAAADSIDVLLVSVLMLRSAMQVARLKAELTRRGAATRVAVGGAPFRLDPELWRSVGADGRGFSASDSIALIEKLGNNP
jgi:methylmalonyl-CoA mutase cobalamin-binding domain/chain